MEKNFCNICGKCCQKIIVDFEQKLLFRNGIEILTDEFAKFLIPTEQRENITYCRCKFLKNNLCVNTKKPESCIQYPSSPFAYIPEECGYSGDIFLKNEQIKQKIRRLKEEILSYKAQILIDKSEEKQLQKIIARHQAFIDKYKIYGSYNW